MTTAITRLRAAARTRDQHRQSVFAHFKVEQPISWLQVLLGAFLIADGVALPGIPMNLPLPEIIMIGLIALSLVGQSRYRQAPFAFLVPLAVVAVGSMVIASEMHDVDWTRRVTRIVLLIIFVTCLAWGRLSARSIVLGMAGGLVVNAGLFYLGIAPDTYGGVLTGFTGDKNVAGLMHAIIPLLVVPFVKRQWMVPTVLLLGFGLLFLTGSRTSLTAFGLAVLWMAVTPRRGPVIRGAVLGLYFWVFTWLEDNFARAFVFEDRDGTDHLRARIDEASRVKTDEALPWGLGASESTVLLQGEQQFFYHDSYLALATEGGWILVIAIVAIYVMIAFRPFSRLRRTPAIIACESATVAILFCALKLGEVFITIVGALALGTTLAVRSMEKRRLEQIQGLMSLGTNEQRLDRVP